LCSEKPGARFTRVGALQKVVALLKTLAIPLRNVDLVWYARASTSEQETAVQVAALKALGCERRDEAYFLYVESHRPERLVK
jgi:hypothetical protein